MPDSKILFAAGSAAVGGALDMGDMSVCSLRLEHDVPEEFLHLMFFGVVGDLVGDASGSPSSLWF